MKYKVIKEIKSDLYLGTYKAYGIAVINKGQTVRKISDISRSFRATYKLCSLCNRLKLDVEQIDEVIEDFLADL